MEVNEPFRRRGYGSFLIQELKRTCYEIGLVPAARCNVSNPASRATLRKAGLLPCARLLSGVLSPERISNQSRSPISQGIFFRAVGAIGNTDTDALPVKQIGPAVGYFTQCLGFSLVSKDRTSAKLKRDDVQIGLAVSGHDPEQASCWFSVGNVDALWRELDAKGIEPGIIDEQVYDGRRYPRLLRKGA